VKTILDVGGGTGAFSIPLAQRGYSVTHLDLSPRMLELARARAGSLANLAFEEGNAVDLSRFADRSFDLVLNLDGAISSCGTAAERAIAESARVTRETLVATVSNRAWLVPVWTATSVEATGRILQAAYEMLVRGIWHQEQSDENALIARGATQDYLGPIRAFLPSELRDLLSFAGLHVVRVSGLGSLANLCREETVRLAAQDPALLDAFVELCNYFDREVMPDGPGTRQRAGLIAVGQRLSS